MRAHAKAQIKPYTILLGATGSVGEKAISVLSKSGKVKIVALACANRTDRLEKAMRLTGCERVWVANESRTTLLEFLINVTNDFPPEMTTGLNAISGFAGLEASIALADLGIDTLLANKESVVAGGKTYLDFAKSRKVRVIPVDSEHSGLWTLIGRFGKKNVRKALITCSGGPFRDREDLSGVTPEEATSNPNWNMGKKISVDSSTLANKLAEIIEAKCLFSLESDQIEAVMQRNSHVHAMIQLRDGSWIAEISPPDMALPIAKAYGLDDSRWASKMDWRTQDLRFGKIDEKRFPFLSLAPKLLSSHAACVAFNAANEEAVRLFMDRRISFTDIFGITDIAIRRVTKKPGLDMDVENEARTFEGIKRLDKLAREAAGDAAAELMAGANSGS